jgi:hypothetical protein
MISLYSSRPKSRREPIQPKPLFKLRSDVDQRVFGNCHFAVTIRRVPRRAVA